MTLNPAQQAAVDSKAALRVVIAGPGSGKTRTEVQAVKAVFSNASLEVYQRQGRLPRVAVMTFTNSGAGEFRHRLGDLAKSLAWCGTLHSYCFKLIQRFGGFLGYIPGKVGILPDAERIPRLLACRDKLGLKKLSQKHLLDVATWPKEMASLDQAALVWREYEFLLKRNNLVDYDGILRVALELIRMSEVRCQVKLDYLFVDEYQDSALIDQHIYGEIPATNVMIVGDPDQSIFAFRGAFPSGMVALATGLASQPPELHKLELNYRSDVDICEAANLLIECNKERVEKMIRPVTEAEGHVGVVAFEDVGQELGFIASTIIAGNNADDTHGETFAVLYRMNHDVKVCRDYLQAMGLPVQVPKFEERPADWELAMLLIGLQITPTEILVERYLLALKFTRAEIDRLKLQSTANGGQFIECARIKVVSFDNPLNVMPYLMMNAVSEGTARMIRERAALLAPDADLSDLLHDLHSNEDAKEPETEGVYVGTIHSAKGREWDVVFLPAFEDGIIPHGAERLIVRDTGRAAITAEVLEEERRLAFVAVTRARHELYISHCAHRRGPWGPVGLGQPSQFISEMGL